MIYRIRRWIAYCPVPKHRYPLFCLGGWIVIHGGKWADIQLPQGWLVVRWTRKNHYLYFSPDGTPNKALWRVGKFND